MNVMDEVTLTNLLNVVSSRNENINWRINCQYDNGEDRTLMEIKFIDIKPERIKGRITYDNYTGEVLRYQYAGLDTSNDMPDITDLILDIINLEKSLQPSLC